MIQSDFIRNYLLDKFKEDGKLSGDECELIIPSIFLDEDRKRHMSVNLENGLWRCFKTGKKGSFISLYAELEGIAYKQAYQKFLFDSFLKPEPKPEIKETISNIELEDTSKFELLDSNKEYDSVLMAYASEYVHKRKLEKYTFYVSKDGFYKERLIIPFFKDNGELFYFQARTLLATGYPKYLNCKSLKSSQVLYPFDYESNKPLFITEGVFDCMAIKSCGMNATTTLSCNTSNEQMEQLKHYPGPLVCAFDTDDAGLKGIHGFIKMAYKHKRSDIFMAQPLTFYKDWNESYMKDAVMTLQQLKNYQPLSKLTLLLTSM